MSEGKGEGHICDYVEPDGTTTGACHLPGPHGGRCPQCGMAAADCPHTMSVGPCEVDGCVMHPWTASPNRQNIIIGQVHGVVIQARDIQGGISF